MLDADETERYARHLVLRDVGRTGQQKFKAARVLVVGAGGLGSAIIQYLAAAGIGVIGVADDDRVSLSNLQRQVIHRTIDVGRLKVESAAAFVAAINPHVVVEPFAVRLDRGNAAGIVAGFDVVVDGVDNFAARFVVADACEAARKPLVSAGVLAFYGWLTVLEPWKAGPDGILNPGLRHLLRRPEQERAGAETGILGVVPGILGTLAAAEVLKLVAGVGQPLVRRMLSVDLTDMSFDSTGYERDPVTDGLP